MYVTFCCMQTCTTTMLTRTYPTRLRTNPRQIFLTQCQLKSQQHLHCPQPSLLLMRREQRREARARARARAQVRVRRTLCPANLLISVGGHRPLLMSHRLCAWRVVWGWQLRFQVLMLLRIRSVRTGRFPASGLVVTAGEWETSAKLLK